MLRIGTMLKAASLGLAAFVRVALVLVASVLAFGAPARADWRSPMRGAEPILPPGFAPQRWTILATPPVPAASVPRTGVAARPTPASAPAAPQAAWSLPLVDRRPTATEKAADLAPELLDAILRIEPIYDPTRVDGPDVPPTMGVSAGTASMTNVFADQWRRADLDPTVDVKTSPIAMAWSTAGVKPCTAFTKKRPHGFGDPALTALDVDDCAALMARQASDLDDDMPAPVVAGLIDVPVFAAPLPGSRLSSQDFWAARRAKILAIQAHLQRKWRADAARPTRLGSR